MHWWPKLIQRLRYVIPHLLLLNCYAATDDTPAEESDDLFDLDIAQLLSVSVNSASRFEETLRDAPATMIVLNQSDLVQRGYRDLSEIYDDLPGMEMSRPFGDTLYRNQWRGLRKSIGTPYLLMLDGLLLNHLWFNQEEIIATMPLSMIDRVEIVYGPASVVYGANAFVGVINIISKRISSEQATAYVHAGAGSDARTIVDLFYQNKIGDLGVSAAIRRDRGQMDNDVNTRYEYLKPRYFRDRDLWGPFAEYSHYADYYSPFYNDAIDLRLTYQQFEVAAQYFRLNTGFGNVYPGDRILNYSRWIEPDLSIYTRHCATLNATTAATTLLRYRRSGVDPDSTTLEGYNVSDNSGTRRVVDFSYWGSDSESVALHEDLTWIPNSRWSVASGLRLERKRLQRAYDITWGSSVEIDACDEVGEGFPFCLDSLADYDWPTPPQGDTVLDNHITTFDRSVYALARVKMGGDDWQGHRLDLHIGARYDHNSEVGSAPTRRIGAVYGFQNWTIKLLYGESFNEPAGRELFGGWQGSGSSPALDPETAETVELSVSYQHDQWQLTADAYEVKSDQNIITFAGGANNLGERDIYGIDLHAQWQKSFRKSQIKLWAYWTHLFEAQQSIPYFVDDQCTDVSHCAVAFYDEDIGDTANDKWWWGATWSWHSSWSLTLRGRHIGARNTVSSNPIQRVDAYNTVDVNFLWRNFATNGLDVGLSVNNLLDEHYFHPGLREADAGTRSGQFDNNGVWQGSEGWYSSVLPQPGRQFLVHLTWRY